MWDKKILKTFGKNVKKYRRARGLSQEQLAKEAGVHRTYIGGIESVGRNVSLINILRIAHALKVRIDDLVR